MNVVGEKLQYAIEIWKYHSFIFEMCSMVYGCYFQNLLVFLINRLFANRPLLTCVSCYCETNYWFEFYNFPRVNLFFMGVQATLIKSRVLSSVLRGSASKMLQKWAHGGTQNLMKFGTQHDIGEKIIT